MPISFNKMLTLFEEKKITSYTIKKNTLMSQASFSKIKSGEGNIDTKTLERLCEFLDCQPSDLIEYVKDK